MSIKMAVQVRASFYFMSLIQMYLSIKYRLQLSFLSFIHKEKETAHDWFVCSCIFVRLHFLNKNCIGEKLIENNFQIFNTKYYFTK